MEGFREWVNLLEGVESVSPLVPTRGVPYQSQSTVVIAPNASFGEVDDEAYDMNPGDVDPRSLEEAKAALLQHIETEKIPAYKYLQKAASFQPGGQIHMRMTVDQTFTRNFVKDIKLLHARYEGGKEHLTFAVQLYTPEEFAKKHS